MHQKDGGKVSENAFHVVIFSPDSEPPDALLVEIGWAINESSSHYKSKSDKHTHLKSEIECPNTVEQSRLVYYQTDKWVIVGRGDCAALFRVSDGGPLLHLLLVIAGSAYNEYS